MMKIMLQRSPPVQFGQKNRGGYMKYDVKHIEVLDYLLGLMDNDPKKLKLIMSIIKQNFELRESVALTYETIEKAKK
jgi:hypothetical protein